MLLNEEKRKYMIIEPQRTKCWESEIRIGNHSVKNADKAKLSCLFYVLAMGWSLFFAPHGVRPCSVVKLLGNCCRK